MAEIEIELNSAGIQELLKSSEVAALCEQQAERMTRATGMKYVADVHVGKTRVNAAGYSNRTEMLQAAGERSGTEVRGYYRTLKNGKTIYVQSYRRKK